MVPAPLVGTPESFVYYSGPRELLDAHPGAPALRVIGTPRWVGEDHGLAQLYYQAQLAVFLTTLSSVLQATALVGSAGVSTTTFLAEAVGSVKLAAAIVGDPRTAQQIESGVHPGQLSTVTMMGATADHIVETCRDARIDSALPLAVQTHYARAIAAGRGAENWTALYDFVKSP
jgi:3-hydroxyisobutyrate dehydrogenase-like beta-hydroxyacid dehydrogenase